MLPADVEDGRGRFREVFCAVLEARRSTIPDSRPCDEALRHLGAEPPGSGRSVDLGPARRRLVAAMVPGLGWGCFSAWLDLEGTATTHVRRFGYDLVGIDVDALSGIATNALQIRDAIVAGGPAGTPPEIVLIGYSKGINDILEAIVTYPEIRPYVAAVVSVAGAVGGSPVADEVTQAKLELLRHWPEAQCSEGDGGGVESLRPAARSDWRQAHALPSGLPYYSLVTCPAPDRVSRALWSSHRELSRIDRFNDGMVLVRDQLIPGSSLLGVVNADHWAVAVPVARSHPVLGATIVDRNDYPREAMLEALLRFVEEDLATRVW